MSKLSFRARALDALKQMPIYICEDLPDLPEYSAINRAVPPMPSGMDKEEECEHHFQRAIVTGLIIPTPEVTKAPDFEKISRILASPYKPPKQLIRMQPFAMEEDYPDYDMDSEDERWLSKQKLDITPLKFEEMMDRLEKNCAQNFASQDRKELLLKDDDELSIAIYDYWLSKRLKTPTALVPTVRTESSRPGGGAGGGNNNPYLAFRRRTEKMQTRKNRKNDEASYEKMIKLKRDLQRALHLIDMVRKREVMKKDLLQLTVQLYEKRYEASDFTGSLLAEVSATKPARPAFTPLYSNQFHTYHHRHHTPPPATNHQPHLYHSQLHLKPIKEDVSVGRREKRQYKRRKHKGTGALGPGEGPASSGEDDLLPAEPPSAAQPTAAFPFLRNRHCHYHPAKSGGKVGNWRWASREEGGGADERFRFSLASVTDTRQQESSEVPMPRRCVGLVRRRLGRGGRVILDRAGPSMDDFWSSVDFKIIESSRPPSSPPLRHFRPKTPPKSPEREIVDIGTIPGVRRLASASPVSSPATNGPLAAHLLPTATHDYLRWTSPPEAVSPAGSGLATKSEPTVTATVPAPPPLVQTPKPRSLIPINSAGAVVGNGSSGRVESTVGNDEKSGNGTTSSSPIVNSHAMEVT